LFHLSSLPIKVKKTAFELMFMSPECEYLLMDLLKQYIARLKGDKLNSCKIISSQTQPVKLTHLYEEGEVHTLQSVRTIPSTCSQRRTELNQTI